MADEHSFFTLTYKFRLKNSNIEFGCTSPSKLTFKRGNEKERKKEIENHCTS